MLRKRGTLPLVITAVNKSYRTFDVTFISFQIIFFPDVDTSTSDRHVRASSRSSGSGDEERVARSFKKDDLRKSSRSRDRRRRDGSDLEARRLESTSSLGVKSPGNTPEPVLPLASTYQDFEEIVSDDDLPEEMVRRNFLIFCSFILSCSFQPTIQIIDFMIFLIEYLVKQLYAY